MKRSGFLFLLSCLGLVSIASPLAFINNPINFVYSTETEWGIVMNKDNTIALTGSYSTASGAVKTTHDNDVNVTYTDAKTYSDGVATLASTGTIINTKMILGIEAITVDFTGSLSVQFSSDMTSYTATEALTSGTKLALAKTYDYFKLVAGSETSINTISIKHQCASRFTLDEDQKLEAEYACLNRQQHWSNDARASGGAYAKDFNDCGQGMYFRYYAFEAGNRDITLAYATGAPGSYMTLFANGSTYRVDYTTNTGWFGDNGGVTADVTVSDVALVQGWNELYLIKNGISTDKPEYGGWAQIDYIIIEGTQKRFDVSEFDRTSYVYNLEGEVGHWHWSNSNQRPDNWGNPFSLGYGLGQINAEGDGVKFDIDIAEAGTYAIRPVVGGNKYIKVSIDDGALIENYFGAYTEWNNPTIGSDTVCQVELTAGFHYMDFHRTGRDNGWFTFDKLVIEKIA